MSAANSREIRLKSRPQTVPGPDNFELVDVTMTEPGNREVQVRNKWMSVDPYMRGRMRDEPSYVPPFQLGKPLEGTAVGEVVQSNDARYKPGDWVLSMFGWRELFNAPGDTIQLIDAQALTPQAYLGIAGVTGLTAYFGLLDVIRIRAGETIFVSAAAGAVGSAACQMAKIQGATVIGSAGGSEKCSYLKEIGVEHTIDYKAEKDLPAALKKRAPQGIDAYFDNVGGEHLEAALAAANPFARFALCGMIASYNERIPGPWNLFNVIKKRLLLQGFIVSDHFDKMSQFRSDIKDWIASGRLTWRETVVDGLEEAPAAFTKLFSGGNTGKMLVKLH